MSMLRWIGGGLIGAVARILIWVLVGYLKGYEVGWIAWGVGFLVGVGVRYAAYLSDQDEGFLQGIAAAGIAIGAILISKWMVHSLILADVEQEVVDTVRVDDEAMISDIAVQVVVGMEKRGQRVNWPSGKNILTATRKEDFPPEVWRYAASQWNKLEENTKQERREQVKQNAALFVQNVPRPAFFSPWDILWFALATVTAYKIGVGTYGDE